MSMFKEFIAAQLNASTPMAKAEGDFITAYTQRTRDETKDLAVTNMLRLQQQIAKMEQEQAKPEDIAAFRTMLHSYNA
jgi:hypothetical protein